MIIKFTDRKPSPEKVEISNRLENLVSTLEFSFSNKFDGVYYIVFSKIGKSLIYPLLDDQFTIPYNVTQKSGTWQVNILVSKIQLKDGIKYDSSNALWVSDTFEFIVQGNMIHANKFDQTVPEPLKIVYDDMLSLTNRLNESLENGDFKGEAGEKGDPGKDGEAPKFEIRDGHLFAIYAD